ncbi:MAG: enoyl-CoA hydratase-related protein [Planctomycetota bacterium]
MAEEPRVLVTRDGNVVTMTLNRPEVRNALDLDMINALHDTLEQLEPDMEIGALILTGAGEKAFVAGADIGQLRERKSPEAFRRINQALFRRLEEFPAPTIAAIRGWALGGGCELAMACDLRVAGSSAKFGQPEVGLGIIPGAGGTHRLQRLVGIGKARELIFTGDIIDADEAAQIGLVNRVVADADVPTAAAELAGRIAKNSAGAVRLAKVVVNSAPDLSDRGRDMMEVVSQAICFDSQDKFDRMTRFLERKKK